VDSLRGPSVDPISNQARAPSSCGISRGYAIGSRFHGWRVVRIERSRIQLRHDDGARAWFEIGSTEGPRSESTGPELDAVEVPGFHYAVGPELLKSEMASEPTFRALIHRGVDGEIDGFRLSGIRSSSLAARLHLENGDIVHAVDGQPLAEIVTGSEVLTRLGETGSVCMSVTRRREPLQICYHLTTE
ncbi:MAG: hypothetical protein AAF211_16665, partial [Myxococcota bacterium]